MASSGDSIPQRFVLVRIRDLNEFKNTFTKAHKDSAFYFHPEIVGECKSGEDDDVTKSRAQKIGQGVSIIGTSKLSVNNTHSEITKWIAEKDKKHEKAFLLWFEELQGKQERYLENHCSHQYSSSQYSKQCFDIMKEHLDQDPKTFEILLSKYKKRIVKVFKIRTDDRKKKLQTAFDKWLYTQEQPSDLWFSTQYYKEQASFNDWLEMQYEYAFEKPFNKIMDCKKEQQDPEPHIKELFKQLKLREEQSNVEEK